MFLAVFFLKDQYLFCLLLIQLIYFLKKYAEMEQDKLYRWRKWKGTWPKRYPRYFTQIKMGLPPMGGTTYTGPSRLLKRQAKKEAAGKK